MNKKNQPAKYFGRIMKVILCLIFLSGFYSGFAQTYQWAKKGVSEGYDYGNAIVTDDSGNAYVGGQIEYTARFDNNIVLNTHGKHDILIGKYNSNGAIQWVKNAGGDGGDLAWGIGIDKNHNIYTTGEFEYTAVFSENDSITSSGTNDIFLAKYGTGGNVLWLRRMGGGSDDKAKACAVSPNGSVYVTGYFSTNSSFGSFNVNSSGGNDVFIAKYSASGTCQWVKKAGGNKEDRGRGVVLDQNGNLYIVGTFTNSINFNGTNYTNANTNNAFIAKYDTSGNFLWAKTAGACCDTSRYNGVTCDASGNAYVIGYFNNEMTVGTNNLTTKGNSDVVIAKYSPSGNVLWARDEGGIREDMGYHLNYDNKKNLLYVTGFYDYDATFDTIHLQSSGNRDAFLAAYDPNGRVQWARTSGGNERDCGQAVAFDTLSNIYETGFFNSNANFDGVHLDGDTLADFFISKISPALAPQPSAASTTVVASLVNCTNVQLNWSPGNGNRRIVVARILQSGNVFPTDGNTYNANAAFGGGTNLGNGNFVVYDGSGNSTTVTGLTAGLQYAFTVIEYNGDNNTTNYNTGTYGLTSYTVNGFAMNLASSVSAICIGSQTTLSASGGVSYQWSPAYGLSTVAGSSVNASPGISTTYTVEGINSNGCHSIEQIVVYVNRLPTVQFDLGVQMCEDELPVSITGGIPSGGMYSGTGVSNGTFNPAVGATGSRIITYTYTDANGCSSSDTTTYQVNALPSISVPAFQSVCSNGIPVVLAGAMPAGGTYSGNNVSAGIFDPSLSGPGTTTITYTYMDSHGCESFATGDLVVNDLPLVTMNGFGDLCQNAASITLSGGNPAGGTFSGTGVNGNEFSPSLAGSGSHAITYTYTDNNGCTNASSTILNVKNPPTVNFASLPSACVNGMPVNLSGGDPVGGMYSGTSVSNNMFDPSASGAGNFDLTYSYTDSMGCTNEAHQTMTVYSLPSLSLAMPSNLCMNSAPMTLVGGNPTGGIYSGQNVMNGVFTPAGLAAGQYSITYTYSDNHNCTNAISKPVNVRDLPSVNLGTDTVVCSGTSVSLDAGSGFASYHWSNGASTQTTHVNMPVATTINCSVSVMDTYGCSNSDALQITFSVCSGVADVKSNYPWCYFYPNPFKTSFTMFSEKRIQIKIYDVSGRLVEEDNGEGSMIAGENLSPGVYIVDAFSNTEKKTYKIIKAQD